jgi:hypothetical protein
MDVPGCVVSLPREEQITAAPNLSHLIPLPLRVTSVKPVAKEAGPPFQKILETGSSLQDGKG